MVHGVDKHQSDKDEGDLETILDLSRVDHSKSVFACEASRKSCRFSCSWTRRETWRTWAMISAHVKWSVQAHDISIRRGRLTALGNRLEEGAAPGERQGDLFTSRMRQSWPPSFADVHPGKSRCGPRHCVSNARKCSGRRGTHDEDAERDQFEDEDAKRDEVLDLQGGGDMSAKYVST